MVNALRRAGIVGVTLIGLAGLVSSVNCIETRRTSYFGPITRLVYPNTTKVEVTPGWSLIEENDKEYVFRDDYREKGDKRTTKISKKKLKEDYGTSDLYELVGESKLELLKDFRKDLD